MSIELESTTETETEDVKIHEPEGQTAGQETQPEIAEGEDGRPLEGDSESEAAGKTVDTWAYETVESMHLIRLQQTALALAAASAARQEAEEELKAAKADEKAAIAAYRKFANSKPRREPLFDGLAGGQGEKETTESSESEGEDWKSCPVLDLSLPDSIVSLLLEADLETVGDLAAWTEQYQLTDVQGIGEAKAEKIEEALSQFWASRDDGKNDESD